MGSGARHRGSHTKKSPYSIDDNLWGRAIECGVLEDPWMEPPTDIYTMTVDPTEAPDEPQYVELEFARGLPYAIDGSQKSFLGIDLRAERDRRQARLRPHRHDREPAGGVKSRECYEVPGALSLIQAHKALEDLVLEREVLHFKLGMEQEWAKCVYNGQWFSPLKEAVDAFLASTQRCVAGTVKLKFYKGSCTVVGRKSAYSLYDYALATYDKDDSFDHAAAKGFIQLQTLSAKTWPRTVGRRAHRPSCSTRRRRSAR